MPLQPRRRLTKDTHYVVTDADTRRVVVVGRPLPVNRNDCKAWEESGARTAADPTATIADGGHPGTGLVIPHRRRSGDDLPDRKQHTASPTSRFARVEHVLARMKTWQILRNCRFKGNSVYRALLGIATDCTTSTSTDSPEAPATPTRTPLTGKPSGQPTCSVTSSLPQAGSVSQCHP
jgi:hypothetical protein